MFSSGELASFLISGVVCAEISISAEMDAERTESGLDILLHHQLKKGRIITVKILRKKKLELCVFHERSFHDSYGEIIQDSWKIKHRGFFHYSIS